MADPPSVWQPRTAALARARKQLRAGEPGGLHDVRVALRRVAATAGAMGCRKVARRARKIVRSLSEDRQLEVDRAFLARVRVVGLLSEDAVTALAARWESAPGAAGDRIEGVAKNLRRLLKKLRALAARGQPDALLRLLAAREAAEAKIAALPEADDDEALHRYRLSIKRARYVAEDLVTCGRTEFEAAASREQAAQDAIGRWNDLCLFRERVDEERDLAERRGAVRLASELGELVGALEEPLAAQRCLAIEAASRISNVVLARPRSRSA